MTGFLVGETHEAMRERANELYARRSREQSFDDWLAAYSERCVVGSVEEVVARLREYERAGCDRIMLQHLLHTDLEPVRLIGGELAPALA
jgi:alkanesulfonate monooxygenase SsuD/methylene tetrahydromethanopterin reductase-like flavin-dependent oxidoreductase (luciferase family)